MCTLLWMYVYISTLNGYIGSTCNYIYNVNGYIGTLLESVLWCSVQVSTVATQTSGFNRSAWWFDHKPLVFSHQSWHLNTFSKSRAHVLFRLWTHLCIIHKKHCDWWKWLHTQPQTFWSHSSNTNKNNNIHVITVFVITGVEQSKRIKVF